MPDINESALVHIRCRNLDSLPKEVLDLIRFLKYAYRHLQVRYCEVFIGGEPPRFRHLQLLLGVLVGFNQAPNTDGFESCDAERKFPESDLDACRAYCENDDNSDSICGEVFVPSRLDGQEICQRWWMPTDGVQSYCKFRLKCDVFVCEEKSLLSKNGEILREEVRKKASIGDFVRV